MANEVFWLEAEGTEGSPKRDDKVWRHPGRAIRDQIRKHDTFKYANHVQVCHLLTTVRLPEKIIFKRVGEEFVPRAGGCWRAKAWSCELGMRATSTCAFVGLWTCDDNPTNAELNEFLNSLLLWVLRILATRVCVDFAKLLARKQDFNKISIGNGRKYRRNNFIYSPLAFGFQWVFLSTTCSACDSLVVRLSLTENSMARISMSFDNGRGRKFK